MFSDLRPAWTWIVAFIVVIATACWVFVLLIHGLPASELTPAALRLGLVITVTTAAFAFLVNMAWSWPGVRNLLHMADLRGRWVGTYVSGFDHKTRPMALEVRQSLLTIDCVSYGPQSRGVAYSSRLLSDTSKSQFMLAYYYHAKRPSPEAVPGDEHEGLVVLTLIPGDPRQLRGWYVNDRDPPKKGTIELEFRSRRLQGGV